MDKDVKLTAKSKPGRKPRQTKPKKVVQKETSKVQEVQTPSVEVIPRRERKVEFPAIINGKPRMTNQVQIDVLSRDKSITIELPEGSPLIIPNPQPCKDC